jgi:hypothetical protein
MSDGSRHFTDLPIFPFGQLQADPAVGNGFADTDGGISGWNRRLGIEEPGLARQCLMITYRNSLREFFQFGGGGDLFHLGPIASGMGILGIEKAVIQARLVAEKKKTLGVCI